MLKIRINKRNGTNNKVALRSKALCELVEQKILHIKTSSNGEHHGKKRHYRQKRAMSKCTGCLLEIFIEIALAHSAENLHHIFYVKKVVGIFLFYIA